MARPSPASASPASASPAPARFADTPALSRRARAGLGLTIVAIHVLLGFGLVRAFGGVRALAEQVGLGPVLVALTVPDKPAPPPAPTRAVTSHEAEAPAARRASAPPPTRSLPHRRDCRSRPRPQRLSRAPATKPVRAPRRAAKAPAGRAQAPARAAAARATVAAGALSPQSRRKLQAISQRAITPRQGGQSGWALP